MPTRRQRSFTGTPASASFNTPTICSSLNRLLFMTLLLSWSYTRRSYVLAGLNFGEQVTGSSPSIQPTVTLTFNTGYANPPMSIMKMTGGTGVVADILASNTLSQSVLTYDGLPVSGKT